MDSLLNPHRPPVFCPGCAHERIVHALDRSFQDMELSGNRIAIVSDIGCSGLFDTFFNTHAFHGLHGRALTYATGIKMARPDLHVVVTMGDGGMGIGGAHVLSTCRRNIDITLLVLNNFNYGMTGGQCSATTPQDAQVTSGFLNRLEQPLDICQVTGAAGAGFVSRVSAYDTDLSAVIRQAIQFDGFSVLDIWGICPGRYTRKNKLTPKMIAAEIESQPDPDQFKEQNLRDEYGRAYRKQAEKVPPMPPPIRIEATHKAPCRGRQDVLFLGSAGQRIITAGELMCLAGATAGLHVTQKNDYPITVLRGHSISEVILAETLVEFPGIETPSVVFAIGQEGVNRRKNTFSRLGKNTLIVKARSVELPETEAEILEIEQPEKKIKNQDLALAAMAKLATLNRILSIDMLKSALDLRFSGNALRQAGSLIEEQIGISG